MSADPSTASAATFDGVAPETSAASEQPGKSYGQILKSSALIGGSSAITMAFAIIRSKAMAMLLGPGGYNLYGLFDSISSLARSIAGLGVNSSGVRQIAESVGSGDEQRIARTVITLRRVAFYSGALGALLLVIFAHPISVFSFKTAAYTGSIALLAIVAFLGDISAAQTALLQGLRRIGDLARINVLGAFYGTIFSIGIVWRFGKDGLVASLICVAAMSIVTSWWYARKVQVAPVRVSRSETYSEASELVKLGLVFMSNWLSVLASAYLTRIIVVRQLGEEAGGFYQAAIAVGSQYVGFILQAMATDFYPRLTAVASNHKECNRLVNEQSEVGLLMAGPSLVATLTMAPFIVMVLFRKDFLPAAPLLRWICLGMMMKVLTWPMGFVIVAKGARRIFFWCEVLSNAGFVALTWVAVKWFGLAGSGIAFFAQFGVYFFIVYAIVHKLTGFTWSAATLKLGAIYLPLVGVSFAASLFLTPVQALILGLLITIPAGLYSIKTLFALVPLEHLPGPVRKLARLAKLSK